MSWTEDRVGRLEPFLAAALDESLGDRARDPVIRERILRESLDRLVESDGRNGFHPQTLLRALELSAIESLEISGR